MLLKQYAVFGSPLGLIHLAVGLPTNIKGCSLQRYSKLRRVSVLATNFAIR
jgi:hypothetical protein